MPEPKRFAMLGVGGFVAPRHLEAIASVGGELVAACDPNDSVGIMDSHFPDAAFFTEFERFDRHLEKIKRASPPQPIDYVSVCSPNYLHDAHCRLGLRLDADVICEKPVVVNPWNLDQLQLIEREFQRQIFTVLQLRYAPSLTALQPTFATSTKRHQVDLMYVTRRGRWYQTSWKGQVEKSGGLATNIGVHLFDMLGWFFGSTQRISVNEYANDRQAGTIEFERADVRWTLSTRQQDLPAAVRQRGGHAHRTLKIDDTMVEFSKGFTGLHDEVYRQVLRGNGLGLEDARAGIELAHRIRSLGEAREI